MKLNTLDPRWDNQLIDHNHDKFNWRQYFIDAVQEKYPQVKELEKLHEVMSPNEINDFVWDVQRICKTEEFARKLDDFMDEVARPRLDGADFMVQDVVGVRVVIPNQAVTSSRCSTSLLSDLTSSSWLPIPWIMDSRWSSAYPSIKSQICRMYLVWSDHSNSSGSVIS